jgi:hypothetical protein
MVQTVHVAPIADLIEHDTSGDLCICGPAYECVPTDDGDGWLVVHHSLDGREREEED